ncbi:MAG: neutral/alkaline non-lysosomal ceramidase N-terminal domain-containing protein [Armatimonadota bacterium]
MRAGFAKTDLTPRIGVELCGFAYYLNRHSIAVRDRIWARAMAIEQGDRRVVVVSNDIIQVDREITREVRRRVTEATGIAAQDIMVHCTHSHSGPATGHLRGFGAPDPPYLELLPRRIADACIRAVGALQDATLAHAEVPCEGIGLNRQYDRNAPPLEDVLPDSWRPAKPELTDTTCHALAAHDPAGRLIGFASYFSCHPVVCCAETRYIHGDYAGVATNLLEREHPGSVGLFLQGAQGDVNSCVVHKPEQESLLALDVIASRYARSVREGLAQAGPVQVDAVASALHEVTFTRKAWGMGELRERLGEQEAIIQAADATDADQGFRRAVMLALGYRELIAAMEAGANLQPATEVQGIRLGPISLLGAPFEIFQAIKREVSEKARSPVPLVMGITNDELGYAPDRVIAAVGGYAAEEIPVALGRLPFANIHDELVSALLEVEAALY